MSFNIEKDAQALCGCAVPRSERSLVFPQPMGRAVAVSTSGDCVTGNSVFLVNGSGCSRMLPGRFLFQLGLGRRVSIWKNFSG